MKKVKFDYIVIGAGPSGLQLGYFFEKNKLDYCILEKAEGAGSFFRKYPRHRKLISINKIYTGYTDPELNLRWDWNSLLSDNPELLLKNYSKEYFPPADDFVRYLEDFSKHYDLNIIYNTEVQEVDKDKNEMFKIKCGNILYLCKNLIVATGIPVQVVPDVEGIEFCEYYSEYSVLPDDYIDKKVLIIGKGNSGFEIADNLVATANKIHLLSPNVVRFAWKTHYVGHVRALNNNHLDTYLLKSQNAVLNAEIQRISKNDNGKYLVSVNYTKVAGDETEELEYDKVIIACGFKMDFSFFEGNLRPKSRHNGKLPDLSPEWESTNIKDLYFAGALSHSRDYKKATSGFIHGFRYNCDALVKILRRKNENKEIEHHKLNRIDINEIKDLIIKKINRSSALWQQFGFFGDVLVLEEESKTGKYFDALPCDYINEVLCRNENEYFIFTLEYGTRHFNPFSDEVERVNRFDAENAQESDFLHPVIRKYSKGHLISTRHLLEDLDGEFVREEHVNSLTDFLNGELIRKNREMKSTVS